MVADSKQYDLCGQVIGGRNESALRSRTRISGVSLSECVDLGMAEGGIESDAQKPITVRYDGQLVGVFTADLLVNDSLILELKANQLLAKPHEVQLVNYLVATGIDEELLLNFGAERLEYKKKFRLPKQKQSLSVI